jgi:acetyl coenzyme A synthetase (ADP forming)-like protein
MSPAPADPLQALFRPASIAVVGATNLAGSVPYDLFHNLLRDGFRGPVYPVSPRGGAIDGVPAFKYVLDIPDPVDLAVIVFPSSVCDLALEQCGRKGIPAAVVISAGFREVGQAGAAREARLREIAERYGIRLVGPNCLGIINTDPGVSLNASFARRLPAPGSIAFLSQSGALCTAVLDYAQARHIGFSSLVSFGNKAGVTEVDLLGYLAKDSRTRVILLYLEEVTDGRGLMAAASRVIAEAGKPVLVLKAGRTRAGAAAAASHTGSLAASDEICDAAFRQAGIHRCGTIGQLLDLGVALANQPLPRGNRVAVITNAGGPGVLATDRAIQAGLRLAGFAPGTTAALKKSLPPAANLANPVDLIGDARVDRYRAAVSAALADEGVDGVLVLLTPQSMTDIPAIAAELCRLGGRQPAIAAQAVGRQPAIAAAAKPLYASFMGQADVAEGAGLLELGGVPQYPQPEDMCEAFAGAWRFGTALHRLRAAEQPAGDPGGSAGLPGRSSGLPRRSSGLPRRSSGLPPGAAELLAWEPERAYLPLDRALRLLACFGLPIPGQALVRSEEEAAAAATQLGFPVALKAVSEKVAHKSDAGAVRLGIATAGEAAAGYRAVHEAVARIPGARLDGVLVQAMASPGLELFLGCKRDPAFGAVVLAGAGGVWVELLRDVSFRIPPFGKGEAMAMLEELSVHPLLAGARGRPPLDAAAVAECILRVARLSLACPQIEELDVNPLLVYEQGCAALDTRMVRRRT